MVHEVFESALAASVDGGNGEQAGAESHIACDASRAISALRSIGRATVDDLHANGKGGTAGLRDAVEGLEDSDILREVITSLPRIQSEVAAAALDLPEMEPSHRRQIVRLLDDLAILHSELVQRWMDREGEQRTELLAEGFHDLRSPLTSVLFLSEALHCGHSGKLTESQSNQVRLIYSATVTVLNIVENVLASHQLSTQQQEKTDRKPFSVTAVREEVERATRPLAAMNGLRLSFDQDCYSARLGDPDVLRRILLNLVSNAIAYTEEGEVAVHLCESDERLYLRVRDTGPGIEDSRLERMFRSGSTREQAYEPDPCRPRRNRRFSGTGLGLSICQRLADIAGGRITVESELGRGSCFQVELPFPALDGLCGPAAGTRASAVASA